MFSKACEYTIKSCIFIAQESMEGRKVSVKKIAKAIHSPEAFVAKLLQPLSREGILISSKGKYGGFSITEEMMQTPLIEIVHLTDNRDIFTRCAMGLQRCNSEEPCPLHHSFMHIRKDFERIMTDETIYNMAKKINDGIAFLKN